MNRQQLIDILRAAEPLTEGGVPSKKETSNEKMRKEAHEKLSAFRVGEFQKHITLVDDEVSDVLAGHLDKSLAREIEQLALGDVKEILLGRSAVSWVKDYRHGLSSIVISALAKIMTNEELGIISRKIFNPLKDDMGAVIGEKNQLDARIQPNSIGDNETEILFSVLEGLSYGCGGAMIVYNPAYDDVENIARLANFFADMVKRLDLPVSYCVLSNMAQLMRARNRGAKVTVGFQNLAGTSKALKGMSGLDIKGILGLAHGFSKLYFETRRDSTIISDADEGIDKGTLASISYGIARYIEQTTKKWTIVTAVESPLRSGLGRTEEQLRRVCAEDTFMAKLHGLTFGLDISAAFHQGISPKNLRAITESIVEEFAPAFLTAVQGNVDFTRGYMTTSPREHARMRAKKKWRIARPMQKRLTELGVVERGLPKATPGSLLDLYAKYKKSGGDVRSIEVLRMEGQRKAAELQAKNLDIGYGCPYKFLTPPLMEKRVDDMYANAQEMLAEKAEALL
ncbi:MAG: ethanolamine ammonia-lyase subunit EutB [Parcubacteria group bacterium]|nr:ethanolamine ammonia-lyase subunit EutB [Parcubacteria group bacterium]